MTHTCCAVVRLLGLLFLLAGLAHAASGDLDPSFGESGVRRIVGVQAPPYGLVIDSQGRSYVLGADTLSRLTPSGATDPAFGNGGTVALPASALSQSSGVLLEDGGNGRLLYLTETGAPPLVTYTLHRLNEDGSLDGAFAAPSITHSRGSRVPLVKRFPDGRILFGTSERLVRYLEDGAADPTFQAPWWSLMWLGAATFADGSTVIQGRSPNPAYPGLVRLLPDGSVDSAFGGPQGVTLQGEGGSSAIVEAIAAMPDGRPVAAIRTLADEGPLHLRRYTVAGQLDTTFGDAGGVRLGEAGRLEFYKAQEGHPASMAIDVQGRIIVAATDGAAGSKRILVARLSANGVPDPTFGTDGFAYVDPRDGSVQARHVVPHALGLYLLGRLSYWNSSYYVLESVPSVMRVVTTPAALEILPASPDVGGVGQPYVQRLLTLGGSAPLAYSVVSGALPSGLSLAADSIEGVPTTAGTYRFHLRTTDSVGAAETRSYRLEIRDATSLVADYYEAILFRDADPSGVAFWSSEAQRVVALGADASDVIHAMSMAFFETQEFRQSEPRTPYQFLSRLYFAYMGRTPDDDGLEYWASQLAGGLPRDAVRNAFLFGGEFETRMGRVFGPRVSRAESRMVVDFYRGLLGRLPDTDGFNYWRGRFRAAQCGGDMNAEVEVISSLFVSLPEYASRQSAIESSRRNGAYVTDLYNAFLRRGGDLPGFQFWVGQLDSGVRSSDEVRRLFIRSPEFQARVQAVIAQGCMN